MVDYDVIILGGGPAGLSAALALGRARRRVLLCDAGTPRNAAAVHLQNFVTQDGVPPSEFRATAHGQLARYETVDVRPTRVLEISGGVDAFRVTTGNGVVCARRIILAAGMIDEPVELDGFADAWGESIFQCPYCHGFEVRDRAWGYLAMGTEGLERGFPGLLQSWTDRVTVFRDADTEVSSDTVAELEARGIAVALEPVRALHSTEGQLTGVELRDGSVVTCEVLYAHPSQRQVGVVAALGLAADGGGSVQADPMTRETSVRGIYAAGDLATRAQGAIFAAATGTQAGAMVNHDLSRTAPPSRYTWTVAPRNVAYLPSHTLRR